MKKTGCLGYIGDYTAQLCGDYDNPLYGSLLNNRDSMESNKGLFCGSNVSKIMYSNMPLSGGYASFVEGFFMYAFVRSLDAFDVFDRWGA